MVSFGITHPSRKWHARPHAVAGHSPELNAQVLRLVGSDAQIMRPHANAAARLARARGMTVARIPCMAIKLDAWAVSLQVALWTTWVAGFVMILAVIAMR